MSATAHHSLSCPSGSVSFHGPGNGADLRLSEASRIAGSKPTRRNYSRAVQQLVWILILILLLLYLATGYVYWAKLESAWPIFR